MKQVCTCGESVDLQHLYTECSRCYRLLHVECALGHGEQEWCEACAPPKVGRRVREERKVA
jgi:hypothetical protein